MATPREPISPAPVATGTSADATANAARMSAHDHTDRSPEQIEREIEATRREMSQTIDAIQQRLSPDYLMDQAMGYLRTGPGTFANNIGKAVRDNPIPVALVGIGVAWLAMGGTRLPAYLRHNENDERGTPDSQTSMSGVREGREYMADKSSSSAGDGSGIGSDIGQRMSDVGHQAGEMASKASERVRQMASDVRELASEWSESATSTASTVGGRAQSLGNSMRAQAQQLGSTVQEQAGHVSNMVSEQTASVQNTFSALMREQPLVVGALGVAIGAMLGALLPSTRQEDELMGETRDRLVDQASEAGQSALRQASDVAKQAASAATDTVKKAADESDESQSDDDPSTQQRQPSQASSAVSNPEGSGSDTYSAANREQGKTS